MHTLVEPWTNAFLLRALLELMLVGIVAGPLGCWVVLERLSYSTESLSHALFPGLVVAALSGVPLLLGGAIGVLVAAVSIAAVGRAPVIGHDTGVAIVITTLFGLGVLLALAPASPPGLQELLFGDPLGVTRTDVLTASALAAVTLGSLAAMHRPLVAVAFDRTTTRALGVHADVVDAALLVLVALAILVGVQALGALLVVAVVVAPAATARLVASRLRTMMTISVLVAVGAAVVGLYVSYYAEIAAGAAIAAVLVATYLLALVGSSVSFPRASAARTP